MSVSGSLSRNFWNSEFQDNVQHGRYKDCIHNMLRSSFSQISLL
uniref:Uncharacterized protein n=1 Tax=Anguilla anguilla TaxID=7936 RepID=A0A0E9U898_ANGAN